MIDQTAAPEVRANVQRTLISNGAVPENAVETFIAEEGAELNLGDAGEIIGLEDAVRRYRDRHTEDFMKLPPHLQGRTDRWMQTYKMIARARDERRDLERIRQRYPGAAQMLDRGGQAAQRILNAGRRG